MYVSSGISYIASKFEIFFNVTGNYDPERFSDLQHRGTDSMVLNTQLRLVISS